MNWKNQKILVTGGAGFIGSWLCDLLVDFGAEVTVVDNLSTGRIKNIDHLNKHKQFKFIESDVCAFRSEEKFDYILHIAGHASPDEYQTHPIETLQTSALGTSTMAELARKNDSILLFSSTSEIYGDTEVIPTPETYWGKVNPIGPRSCYDEGKRFAEALLVAYERQYGLDVRVPRIFNSYGPRLREDGLYGRALSRFILQALTKQPITVYGDGKQTRSFCYVDDLVEGIMKVMFSQGTRGEIFNLGNPGEFTMRRLAEIVKEVTGSHSEMVFSGKFREDDPMKRQPDISKVKKATGWEPKIGLEEGLKKTIEYYQDI